MRSKIKIKSGLVFLLSMVSAIFVVDAQAQVFVYPKNNQDQQTQIKDQQECQLWAQQQSGYNPASVAYAPTYTSKGAQQGSALMGAAGGALKGAAVAGISDGDTGKGAAAGAIGGAIMGRMRSKRQADEVAAAQNRAVQETHAAGYSSYEKACKTCLEGRGYSVN